MRIRRHATWSGLLPLSFILAVAGALTGCGAKTISLRPSLPALSSEQGLDPITVYLFADKRDEEPKRVGGIYGGYRNLLYRLYGDEDAATTVTRAFAEGLKARGVSTTIMMTQFAPGASHASSTLVLTGEVRDFWTEAFYVNTAKCRVLLRLYETTADRPLWEKEYGSDFSGGLSGGVFANVDDLRANLASLLGKAVESAVTDPELLGRLSRR